MSGNAVLLGFIITLGSFLAIIGGWFTLNKINKRTLGANVERLTDCENNLFHIRRQLEWSQDEVAKYRALETKMETK